MTTRLERLAQQKARTAEQHAALQTKLAQLAAQERAVQRATLQKRRALVGKLVEDAGLFTLDDATLGQLFAVLTPLVDMPNPVAVLEALLGDGLRQPGRPVDGMAQAAPGVAPAVPVKRGFIREVAAQLPSNVPQRHQN